MTLMRFRSLAENGKIVLIEDIIKNSSLKKLSITPINMADFYFEFKNYDLATKYVKLITHQEYFDYKIEMLKYMEKYEDLLEVAISSKNLDKIPDIINDVLKRKPELQNKVDELCKNYKINLS
jgi:archaellum biogenesis ATPase FlaH